MRTLRGDGFHPCSRKPAHKADSLKAEALQNTTPVSGFGNLFAFAIASKLLSGVVSMWDGPINPNEQQVERMFST